MHVPHAPQLSRLPICQLLTPALTVHATARLTLPRAQFYCHEAPAPTPDERAAGKACTSDADCPLSYCLDYLPHLPPYVCHDSDFPKCSNPDIKCDHMGDVFSVGCTTTADCAKVDPKSYCMNQPPHVPPFVCHTSVAPVCECNCVSNWVGPNCDTWNGTDPSPDRINRFFNKMKALQNEELQKQQQFSNPYSGWVGNGFDILTGTVKAPVLSLSYMDPTKTWQSHRLPMQATFTNNLPDSGPLPPQFIHRTSTNYAKYSSLATPVKAAFDGMFTAEQMFEDVLAYQNLPSTFNYFKGDDALGYTVQTFELNQMTLNSGTSLEIDRYVQFALQTLPAGYSTASEKQAYKAFVSNWGSHYVTSSTSGGILFQRNKYKYWLSAGTSWTPPMSDATIEAKFAADFELTTMLGADGTALSASAEAADKEIIAQSSFSANRELDGATCVGGNAVETCNAGSFDKWVASLPTAPAPIRIQLANIWELAPAGPIQDNLKAAVTDMMAEVNTAAAAVNDCSISCAAGSSCTDNVCSCTVAHSGGRLCDMCESGWGHNNQNCQDPYCAQCNAGGGTCTAPNTCTCASCYAGSDCGTYTCGCFDAEGTVSVERDGGANETVPLSQVRVGDRVLSIDEATGMPLFSDVFYVNVGNADGGATADVVEVTVDGVAAALRLTREHLVFASKNGLWSPSGTPASMGHQVQAGALREGDYVWMHSGGSAMAQLRRVEAVAVASRKTALVSVHTLAGPVLVDGVLASSYESDATLAMLEATEARWVYKLAPSIAKSELYQAHARWWDENVSEPLLQPAMLAIKAAFSAVVDAVARTGGAAVVGVGGGVSA